MKAFKSEQDFQDACKIIEDSINLMKQGKYYQFKNISTQLYIILIDRGNKKGPLFKEIIPNLRLHPLIGSTPKGGKESPLKQLMNILGENSIIYPSKVSFVSGKPISQYMFDEREPLMEIDDWLEQPLLTHKITIKKLLSKTRHKIASHSDIEYDTTLSQTRFFKIANIELDALGLLSIGEYVLRRINYELQQ